MGAPFRSINQAPLSNEPGAPASSLFLYQTEAGMAEKNFLETAPPYLRVRMTAPPPPYLKVWIRHCPLRRFYTRRIKNNNTIQNQYISYISAQLNTFTRAKLLQSCYYMLLSLRVSLAGVLQFIVTY